MAEETIEEWARNDILRLKKIVSGVTDPASRAGLSMALSINWGMFTAVHGSLAAFSHRPREAQMDYYRKYVDFVERARGMDPSNDVALDLIAHVISSAVMMDVATLDDLRSFMNANLGVAIG